MGKNEKNFNSNLGFTLVELLMVVGIIGILVAMISPNLIKYIDQANKASDIQAAGTIAETLDYNLIFDDEASNEWYGFEKTWLSDGRKHSWIHFNVRDYDGTSYVVYNAMEFSSTKAPNGKGRIGDLRDATGGACKQLAKDLCEEVNQSGVTMKFTKKNTKLMRVVKRADNGRVEVWVGGDGEGRNCNIYYRLYPDADPRYMSNDYSHRPIYGGRRQDGSTWIIENDGSQEWEDENTTPVSPTELYDKTKTKDAILGKK